MITEDIVHYDDKKLNFYEYHEKHAAKIIDFGNWKVPAYYTSIIDEHVHVRNHVGLFDISHMGVFGVTGRKSREFLQYVLSNDVAKYDYGVAFYSLLCNEFGGIVDDVFVYPIAFDNYVLAVNALNTKKDFNWLTKNLLFDGVEITDLSDERSLLAVQGPESDLLVSSVFGINSKSIGFHKFITMQYEHEDILIASTGYTGERGFEIVYSYDTADKIWDRLLLKDAPVKIKPIGFGARDTLRLEAGCPLYGHELDETINPYEANLGWTVKLKTQDTFIGRDALEQIVKGGRKRALVGFSMIDRAIPRQGYPVCKGTSIIGTVTSGSYLPTIEQNGGIALVEEHTVEIADEISIEIRSKQYKAKVVPLPFYKRAK